MTKTEMYTAIQNRLNCIDKSMYNKTTSLAETRIAEIPDMGYQLILGIDGDYALFDKHTYTTLGWLKPPYTVTKDNYHFALLCYHAVMLWRRFDSCGNLLLSKYLSDESVVEPKPFRGYTLASATHGGIYYSKTYNMFKAAMVDNSTLRLGVFDMADFRATVNSVQHDLLQYTLSHQKLWLDIMNDRYMVSLVDANSIEVVNFKTAFILDTSGSNQLPNSITTLFIYLIYGALKARGNILRTSKLFENFNQQVYVPNHLR